LRCANDGGGGPVRQGGDPDGLDGAPGRRNDSGATFAEVRGAVWIEVDVGLSFYIERNIPFLRIPRMRRRAVQAGVDSGMVLDRGVLKIMSSN
jgi:hypothetical protein